LNATPQLPLAGEPTEIDIAKHFAPVADPYSPGPPLAQAGPDLSSKFDWNRDPGGNILIPTQPETAVYRNGNNQVVILQRNEDIYEDDPFVFFSEEHLPRLIERLQQMAKGAD
jgi:hypothetical protein